MAASNKKNWLKSFYKDFLNLQLNPDAQSEDVHGEQDNGAGDVLARHGRDRDVGAARCWLGRRSALSRGAALNCCSSLASRSSHRPGKKWVL
jgi:hypothetical protein